MLKIRHIWIPYYDKIRIRDGQMEIKPGQLCLLQSADEKTTQALVDLLLLKGKTIDERHIEIEASWPDKVVGQTVYDLSRSVMDLGVYHRVDLGILKKWLRRLGLTRCRNRPCQQLSLAQRERAFFALNLSMMAELVILSYPFTHQSPQMIKRMVNGLEEACQDQAILVVTDKTLYFHHYHLYRIEKGYLHQVMVVENRDEQWDRMKSYLSLHTLLCMPLSYWLGILLIVALLALGISRIMSWR